MSKFYEMIIYTASLSKYADPLVTMLDPSRQCSYRLFREHCTLVNNAFVKDLTRLGRPMKDVIIVDNSPIAFMF
jgi:RNA polymerase II subunit A small phosphatase-like protein